MQGPLSHLDDQGRARQVDVSDKASTLRQATARARIRLPALCQAALREHSGPKGDVLAVARIAAIQAAKRTSELIPLCHQIPLTGISVEESLSEDILELRVTVRCQGSTGVEMEALTAASIGALTVYDMLKALSHDMVIEGIELLQKSGGKSGDIKRKGSV